MRLTPILVLKRAVFLGLKLGTDADGMLTAQPFSECPHEFREVLREHKTALVALLRLPFVMVYSKALGEMIFVCEDDDTRETLIDAGAQDVIYTRDQLRILIEHNRARPFVPDELIRLHDAKKLFNAKINERKPN